MGWGVAAASMLGIGPAQLVYPQNGQTGGEPQQDDCVGRTHGRLHAVAVVLVCHPLLYFNLSFFDLFVVHAGMDAG